LNTGEWRQAFATGQQLAKLPPQEGLAILRDNWSSVTNIEARQQLLKAFTFAKHERLPAVLELGLLDPAPLVQEWALGYLREVALHDFWSDYAAAKEWLAARRDKPLATAFADGVRQAAETLRRASGEELRAQLKVLETAGSLLASYPAAAQTAKLDAALAGLIEGPDDETVCRALRVARSTGFDDDWCRRVVLPRLAPGNPWRVREAAAQALAWGKPGREWAVEPLLTALTNAVCSFSGRTPIWGLATALGEVGSPKAIPTMIGLIEADNTYDTVYGIGYFGLGRMTGVNYDEKHDGAWWRQWWEKNKQRFPASVQALEIPRFPVSTNAPRAQADLDELADVADIPAEQHFANGDTNKLYFLIGETNGPVEAPQSRQPLVVVLPGGDGGRDFQPFITRICKYALPQGYLAAQLSVQRF
jgi:hypothetical protein